MNEINREAAIRMILQSHIGIAASWKEHLDFWGEEKPGITNDFSPYVRYVERLILSENLPELEIVASLIKQFIEHGNHDVQYGAKYGFLEGLTNLLLRKSNHYQLLFVQHLKPKSKEFCIELDKFWGTETAGLENA